MINFWGEILRVYAPAMERFHDYGKGFIRFAMI